MSNYKSQNGKDSTGPALKPRTFHLPGDALPSALIRVNSDPLRESSIPCISILIFIHIMNNYVIFVPSRVPVQFS